MNRIGRFCNGPPFFAFNTLAETDQQLLEPCFDVKKPSQWIPNATLRGSPAHIYRHLHNQYIK